MKRESQHRVQHKVTLLSLGAGGATERGIFSERGGLCGSARGENRRVGVRVVSPDDPKKKAAPVKPHIKRQNLNSKIKGGN